MKKFNVPVVMLLASLCGGLSLLTSAYAAEVSRASAKALIAVQAAQKAKRYDEMITKGREALAIPEKTPYDAYVTHKLMSYAYQQKGNKGEQLKAMQGQLDSGYPGAAEQKQILGQMVGLAYNAKDYLHSAEFGTRMIRGGTASPEIYEVVADSLARQGKTADAAKLLGTLVAEQERRGQVPRETALLTLRSLQEKQGNKSGATTTLEKLVVNYPKPDYWNLITYTLTRGTKLTDRQTLQVYRLKMATGTLNRCDDFAEMADMASAANMPGEAQKIFELGLTTKVCSAKVDEDRLRRRLAVASKLVAEDRATLGKLEAEARVSKSGEPDVELGAQLFGFGDYAKAESALSRGIAKGGLKNLSDAELTLATAQYRANNKATALKTLRSIKTDDPVMQRIVKLWILYAS